MMLDLYTLTVVFLIVPTVTFRDLTANTLFFLYTYTFYILILFSFLFLCPCQLAPKQFVFVYCRLVLATALANYLVLFAVQSVG